MTNLDHANTAPKRLGLEGVGVVELAVKVFDPFWDLRLGGGEVDAAAGDGPVVEPGGADVRDEVVGLGVRRVGKGGLKGDEDVAVFAEEVEEVGEVVGLEPGGVEEEDLSGFVAEEGAGELLVVGEGLVGEGEPGLRELWHEGGVVTVVGGVVEVGEVPVAGVDGDGGDAVAAADEELLGLATGVEIGTGVEVGVAEVVEVFLVGLGEHAGDGLALDDVVLPILEIDVVEGSMGEGVVAEIEAGVEPGVEDGDAGVGLAGLVETLFVDEANGRDLFALEGGEEFGVEGGDVGGRKGHGAHGGEIVDGEGDGAGLGLCEGGGEEEGEEELVHEEDLGATV